MQDVSQGNLRVRIWPRHKKRRRTIAEKQREQWFTDAQFLSKNASPDTQKWALTTTADTPLLPRDIMTMWFAGRLFSLQNQTGKRYYPMAFLKDVSESLDVFSQTPGAMLVRGAQYWEPFDISQFLWGDIGLFEAHLDPTITVTNAGWQQIKLNTVTRDTKGWWNNTSKCAVIDQPGIYLFNFRVAVVAYSLWAGGRGSSGALIRTIGSQPAAAAPAMGGMEIIQLDSGSLELSPWVFSSGSTNGVVGSSNTWMQLIGPIMPPIT